MVEKYTKNQKLAIFVAYIIGYLGLQLVIVGVYAAVTGNVTQEALLEISPEISAITGVVTFLALGYIARKQLIDSLKGISNKHNIILAIIGYGVMLAITVVLGLLYQLFNIDSVSSNQVAIEQMMAQKFLLMALPIAFFIPVLEEILFRGVILEFFEKWTGIWGGIILSSLVFGILHIPNLESLSALPQYVALGLVLGYIYVKSGKNILVSIIPHIINNAVGVIAFLIANGGL